MALFKKSEREHVACNLRQHPLAKPAIEKLYHLYGKRDTLEREIGQIQSAVVSAKTALEMDADRLLAEGGVATATANTETLTRTIEQKRRDRLVVLKAIERHMPTVTAAKDAATQDIRRAFLVPYRAVGERVADALRTLEAALHDEWKLRCELEALEVSVAHPLVYVNFPRLGNYADGDGRPFFIKQWFEDTAAFLNGVNE